MESSGGLEDFEFRQRIHTFKFASTTERDRIRATSNLSLHQVRLGYYNGLLNLILLNIGILLRKFGLDFMTKEKNILSLQLFGVFLGVLGHL